jgi:hypothetical protein
MEGKEVTLDQFKDAAKIVQRLVGEGKIYIAASPIERANIVVQVDKQSLEETLKSTPFSYNVFTNVLNQMSRLLSWCLDETEQIYVNSTVQEWQMGSKLDPKIIAEKKALLQEEIEVVKEQLLSNSLRERYFFKGHSKSPYFVGCDWEIDVKYSDSVANVVHAIPYVTCQIRYARPKPAGRFPWMAGWESLEFDLMEDEVDYMSRILNVIKERMHSVKQNIAHQK